MKKLWGLVGRSVFRLGRPLFVATVPRRKRTRLLLVCGNCVLVTKRWVGTGKWGLPGGGLRAHETPRMGVLRELREETGISVPEESIRGPEVCMYRENGVTFKYYLFTVRLKHTIPIRLRWPEMIETRWLDHRTLSSHVANDDVLDAVYTFFGRH